MNNVCIQCGQDRATIKRNKYFCATVSNTEAGMETDQEWSKHRFRPYSVKELAKQEADEQAYIKQMGEMAEYWKVAILSCPRCGSDSIGQPDREKYECQNKNCDPQNPGFSLIFSAKDYFNPTPHK